MSVNKGLSIYKYGGITPEYVQQLISENGKGVFYADYNITSRDDVMTAINDGKSIICRRTNNDDSTDYAVLDFKGSSNDLEFFGVHDSKVLKFILSSSDVWSYQETPIGGDSPIFEVTNGTLWDDAKAAWDAGKTLFAYWNPTVLYNYTRLYIFTRLDGNNFYFSSFSNNATGSGSNLYLDYYYWYRDSGQNKGGTFGSNKGQGDFFSVPPIPNRNTGVYHVQVIKNTGLPSWSRYYGNGGIIGDNNSTAAAGYELKDSQNRVLLCFLASQLKSYMQSHQNEFICIGLNNSGDLDYKRIYNVPSTSSHYNQTLRSKNDGTYGWEPTINDIRLYYDSSWKIDKNYTDIKALINLDRPVRVKLEVGTNDNIYLDFVRDYSNSGSQSTDYLIFQKNLIDVSAGNMDCYTLKIMGDSTINYTHTIYTM